MPGPTLRNEYSTGACYKLYRHFTQLLDTSFYELFSKSWVIYPIAGKGMSIIVTQFASGYKILLWYRC